MQSPIAPGRMRRRRATKLLDMQHRWSGIAELHYERGRVEVLIEGNRLNVEDLGSSHYGDYADSTWWREDSELAVRINWDIDVRPRVHGMDIDPKRLGVLRVCRQRLDLAADYEVQGQDAVDGTAAQYVPSSRLHHERFGAIDFDLSVQSWCPVGGVLPRNGGSGENVLVESGGDLGRREAFEHRC